MPDDLIMVHLVKYNRKAIKWWNILKIVREIYFPFTSVSCLASVNPVAVDVDGLGEGVYAGLEVFHAHSALDEADIALPVHLHIAHFLMVTEWTVELRVQMLNLLGLHRRLPLRLSLAHLISRLIAGYSLYVCSLLEPVFLKIFIINNMLLNIFG